MKTQYIVKSVSSIGDHYYTGLSWSGLIEDAWRYPGYVEAMDGMDKLPKGIYKIEKIFVK